MHKSISTFKVKASIILIAFFSLFILSSSQRLKFYPPNIIIVLVDDMGFADIGSFGSEINTPNLDKLAKGGLRMTSFYNSSRCAPSRAALLTGLYPHQAGVGDMMDNFGVPSYQGHLNDSCATIAELLHEAGYYTIVSGKWHVGLDASSQACKRGFDKSFTLLNNGSNYYNTQPLYNDGRTVTLLENCQKIEKEDHDNFFMTEAITDFAIKSLNDQVIKTNPFFLYLTYTAPHWPLHARQKDIQKYKGKYSEGWEVVRRKRHEKQLEEEVIQEDWLLSALYEKSPKWDSLTYVEKDIWDTRMAIYAAMIEKLDSEIGRILLAVSELKKDKNTIVVFLSDNGGSADEVKKLSYVTQKSGEAGTSQSIDSYGPEWGNVSNTPFIGYKKNMHEGGISTPFIAYYPGVIPPGSISDSPAHIIDLMPTCLELAGVKYPGTFKGRSLKKLSGISIAPLFKGNLSEVHNILFWEHEGNKAVRKGKWKLVSDYSKKEWELYNMEKDRTETTDLSKTHPEIVKDLSNLYKVWAKEVNVKDWGELSSTSPLPSQNIWK